MRTSQRSVLPVVGLSCLNQPAHTPMSDVLKSKSRKALSGRAVAPELAVRFSGSGWGAACGQKRVPSWQPGTLYIQSWFSLNLPILNLKHGLSTDFLKVRVTRNDNIFLIKENLAKGASCWSKNCYVVCQQNGRRRNWGNPVIYR